MKAISIKQPWAWLIVHGIKDVENREWPTKYRGPLLIHASKGWSQSGFDFICDRMDEWVPHREYHAFGAIVGKVDLIGCVGSYDSRWFFGPWGLVFARPIEFEIPIPYCGQLGIFDIPDKFLHGGNHDNKQYEKQIS